MNLTEILDERSISLDLATVSVEETVSSLVDRLVEVGAVTDRNAVVQAILQREKVMSTGVGSGIAIPHAYTTGVARLAVAFARTREPIDFNALDGRPVRLIFLVVGPEHRVGYLRVLSRISRLLYSGEMQRRLSNARSSADALTAIRQEEEKITSVA